MCIHMALIINKNTHVKLKKILHLNISSPQKNEFLFSKSPGPYNTVYQSPCELTPVHWVWLGLKRRSALARGGGGLGAMTGRTPKMLLCPMCLLYKPTEKSLMSTFGHCLGKCPSKPVAWERWYDAASRALDSECTWSSCRPAIARMSLKHFEPSALSSSEGCCEEQRRVYKGKLVSSQVLALMQSMVKRVACKMTCPVLPGTVPVYSSCPSIVITTLLFNFHK